MLQHGPEPHRGVGLESPIVVWDSCFGQSWPAQQRKRKELCYCLQGGDSTSAAAVCDPMPSPLTTKAQAPSLSTDSGQPARADAVVEMVRASGATLFVFCTCKVEWSSTPGRVDGRAIFCVNSWLASLAGEGYQKMLWCQRNTGLPSFIEENHPCEASQPCVEGNRMNVDYRLAWG